MPGPDRVVVHEILDENEFGAPDRFELFDVFEGDLCPACRTSVVKDCRCGCT